MVKLVIIGCGRIAQNHIAAAKQFSDVKIVGLFDHNGEKAAALAETLGCKGYGDMEELLNEQKPDAAVICVPTFAHEEYVKICASHKVAVLCEKPLERTTGACERLLSAVKEADIIFMTAQVVRFWPGYVEIKEMVDRGELGDIYMIRCRRVTSRDDAVAKWLNMPKLGGGAIHDMLVHDVDFLRYLCGPFKTGFANATKDETGCYNNVMANILCKNGVHAMAEASFTMQTGYPFSFSISLIGSKATLEYNYHAGIRIADTDEQESSFRIWREGTGLEELSFAEEDAFKRQLGYFVECVKKNEKPTLITPEQTYEVIKMIDALHESAHSGQNIELDTYQPFDFKKK